MDSSELRHRTLQPPPQHPSNTRSPPTSPLVNGSPPSPKPFQPRLPPRPAHYLTASDEITGDKLAQDPSSSQELLRAPAPPRHPSFSRQSSESILPTHSSEHRSEPTFDESDPPLSVSDSTLHAPEGPDVHTTPVNVPVSENNLPSLDHSMSFESAYEKSLSERELRELYDDEEIDRFLSLFSAHVNEVKLQGNLEIGVEIPVAHEGAVLEGQEVMEDGEWTPINGSTTSLNISPKAPNKNSSLSEQIAYNYVIPFLPSAPPPRPPFSLGRLRLTTQRLYLALEPCYRLVVLNLIYLATWQDKNLSLKYCAGFWVLWFNNLLLPSLILYLLYSLLRQKMYPYPTLKELREYREQVDRAKEVGEELQTRLTASSPFGVREVWRMYQIYNTARKTAGKLSRKGKELEGEPSGAKDVPDDDTLLDEARETKKEGDMKAMALEVIAELTDGLERLKNIFLWRRPSTSNAFAFCLLMTFIMVLMIPTKYLAKIFLFVVGVTFWHVPPIVIAIPPQYRRCFISLLQQSPTDADYAMELIARRIASGQEIKPLRRNRRPAATSPSLRGDPFESNKTVDEDNGPDQKTKKKFKKGVGIVTALASEGAKMVGGEQFLHKTFTPDDVKGGVGETRTYPCQYKKALGAITLTSTTLFFTTLMSSSAKVVIPLDQITGIKKGFSKTISIQLPGDGTPKIERFLWVYERDDLFARLVGTGGRKWLKV